jgi:transposase
MKEPITSFVGLDVHKDSIAVAVAEAGRQPPRFIGTVNPEMASLCKALRRIASAERSLISLRSWPVRIWSGPLLGQTGVLLGGRRARAHCT